MAYLWPGLPHLWVEGSWAGLVLAIGFTALANLAIVSTFIWPELLEPRERWVGGVALAALWLAALWETRGELRRQAAKRRAEAQEVPDPDTERQAEADRRFMVAQRQYLSGDWTQTERTLLELIKANKQDVEAQLLLATVWRHLGRTRHAERRLRKLARLEMATPWAYEIERELDAVSQLDTMAESSDAARVPPEAA